MQHPEEPYFDPTWRDDVFDMQAIDAPLILPEETPRKFGIWVGTKYVSREYIFKTQHTYDAPRLITHMLKPSDLHKYCAVQDQDGNILSPTAPAMDLFFPPKAWVSDAGEERCGIFAAAKRARGHVLVGGLGMGIYPQFALALGRPVESVTVLEHDPDVIEIVTHAWKQQAPKLLEKVAILEGTIEEYLEQTDRTFDTIYLDTWEDADPRFLAHINYLIALATPRCSPGGQIQCWGYAIMVNTFIETVKDLLKHAFPLHEHFLDPVLQAFVDWHNAQERNVTEDDIVAAARQFAFTVKQSNQTYERHLCFTAFGTSMVDAHRNMALSRKKQPERRRFEQAPG